MNGTGFQAQSKGAAKRVVLTGGPCGGKTTAQSVLTESLENDGWKVFHVPETATILLNGGVIFSELNAPQIKSFQENLLKTMLSIERVFFDLADSLAESGKNAVVICDRGALDPSAYCEPEVWAQILKENDFTDIQLRDARYECVIHLVTAAQGAEAFYSNSTNSIRAESIELAREVDRKTATAWIGHPYFDVIDNSTNFDKKLQRVVSAVKKRLQIPDKLGDNLIKRKFLLKGNAMDQRFPVKYQDFEVQHDYLVSHDGIQTRIRKRGQNGVYTYTVTYRQKVKNEKVETRRDISYREYEVLLGQRDPEINSIIKTRRCFVWDNQYFQIDTYLNPQNGLSLLEAYMSKESTKDVLPSFLTIEYEVTDDEEYSMFNLGKKNSPNHHSKRQKWHRDHD